MGDPRVNPLMEMTPMSMRVITSVLLQTRNDSKLLKITKAYLQINLYL